MLVSCWGEGEPASRATGSPENAFTLGRRQMAGDRVVVHSEFVRNFAERRRKTARLHEATNEANHLGLTGS
jgi:hypothetical protein